MLGSATTGALPKNFAGVFKSEDLWQRVLNGVYECRPVHSLSSRMLVLKNGPLLFFIALLLTSVKKIQKNNEKLKKRRLHTFF